jgi:hypothetical protein
MISRGQWCEVTDDGRRVSWLGTRRAGKGDEAAALEALRLYASGKCGNSARYQQGEIP